MDIKIDLVDKIPPGIPKVVIENYNEKETQSDAPKVPPTVESNVIKKEAHNDGILPHSTIHRSFSGIANKSGQILLFSEVTSMWHRGRFTIVTITDTTAPIENAIVDGILEIGLPYYDDATYFLSAKIHATTPDKSKESHIDWTNAIYQAK